jgi:hypothetical protein
LIRIDAGYDPCDRIAASNYVQQHHAMGEVVTGLLYVDLEPSDMHSNLGTVAKPLNALGAGELSPGAGVLERICGGSGKSCLSSMANMRFAKGDGWTKMTACLMPGISAGRD